MVELSGNFRFTISLLWGIMEVYMDLFEKSEVKKKEKHPHSVEIFSRKKGRCSARYGTKKPIEKVNQKELLIAWREDV